MGSSRDYGCQAGCGYDGYDACGNTTGCWRKRDEKKLWLKEQILSSLKWRLECAKNKIVNLTKQIEDLEKEIK